MSVKSGFSLPSGHRDQPLKQPNCNQPLRSFKENTSASARHPINEPPPQKGQRGASREQRAGTGWLLMLEEVAQFR